MRQNITEARLNEIWNLAREGQESSAQLSDSEVSIFRQYLGIHRSLASAWQSAPVHVIDLAKSIAPASVRKFRIGTLVRPRPMLGLARGAISQIQFESDELVIRMQVEDLPNGWKIWGRANQPGWTIWSGQTSQECDENGDFVLDVHSKDVEPLSIQNESVTILLPMSDQEIGDGER